MAKHHQSHARKGEANSATETETKTPATPVVEEKVVQFAPERKYANKAAKAKEANLDYDPAWAKRDATFTVGYAPKTEKSVFGRIYALVAANPGIKGSDLAKKIRYMDFPNRKRSVYLIAADGKGGIPAVGWAEGYVDGAVTKQFLKMTQAPIAPKAEAAPAAETKPEA